LYWLQAHREPTAPALPERSDAVAPANPAAAEAAEEAAEQSKARVLTLAGEGADARLRQRLLVLSSMPAWQAWLASTPDLIESLAVIIANVSDDEDPRRRLSSLRPASGFEVVEQGGHAIESSASMHRYDAATEVLESLDARALAPIWRGLHPLISVAYHSVGRPGVSLDRAASNALRRIADAPIAETPRALQRVGKLWLYSDPDLEKEGTLEKQLQRMGPANARKLQAKAREIRAALGLP
jgi:hypothetical protein